MRMLLSISTLLLMLVPLTGVTQVKLRPPIVSSQSVITKDATIVSPANDDRVKSPLIVKGNGKPNLNIELQVKVQYTGGEEDLGTFEIRSNSSGGWNSVPINLWMPEGAKNPKFVITAGKAGETNSRKIDKITVHPPANVVTVARKDLDAVQMREVKLKPVSLASAALEALKSPAPTISAPRAGSQVSSPLIIKGTGEKDALVEVEIRSKYSGGEQHLGTFRTKSDNQGNWQTIPVNLWAPDEAKNLSYSIKATQYTEEKGHSRAVSLSVTPHTGTIMVVNAQPKLQPVAKASVPVTRSIPARAESKAPEKTEAKEAPAELGPVSEPTIVTPQSGSLLMNDRFQVMGIGIPQSQVNTKVFVTYFQNRRKQEKTYEFQTRTDGNGVWRTQMNNYALPSGAYDITYDIQCDQVRAEDSKRSRKSRSIVRQIVAPPKLTKFVYKAPDLPSRSTEQIWDWLTNAKYRESFVLEGTGGPGLKLDIILDVVRNNVQSLGRTGTVEVGSDGKWKWETAWKYTDDSIDSFVIKLTQSNPGNADDRSETVIEYRTK